MTNKFPLGSSLPFTQQADIAPTKKEDAAGSAGINLPAAVMPGNLKQQSPAI